MNPLKDSIIFKQNVNGVANDKPLMLIERDGVSRGIILAQNFWRQRMYDYKLNENYLKFDKLILDICKSLILSNRKFERRFRQMEKEIRKNNQSIEALNLHDLEALWEKAKKVVG